MYAVRDEADHAPNNGGGERDDMEKIDELTEHLSTKLKLRVGAGGGSKELSLASMLWAHPQHVLPKHSHSRQSSGDYTDTAARLRSDSAGSSAESVDGWDTNGGGYYPPHFYNRRDDLRQSVMEAIQEMMSELEDLHKNINDQATQHIHAGEIILTYALSKTVELVRLSSAMRTHVSQSQ